MIYNISSRHALPLWLIRPLFYILSAIRVSVKWNATKHTMNMTTDRIVENKKPFHSEILPIKASSRGAETK